MSNAWNPEKNDFSALKGKVVVITGEHRQLSMNVYRWS
jgi:hypothetical protein